MSKSETAHKVAHETFEAAKVAAHITARAAVIAAKTTEVAAHVSHAADTIVAKATAKATFEASKIAFKATKGALKLAFHLAHKGYNALEDKVGPTTVKLAIGAVALTGAAAFFASSLEIAPFALATAFGIAGNKAITATIHAFKAHRAKGQQLKLF